jgi:hypothetical protein
MIFGNLINNCEILIVVTDSLSQFIRHFCLTIVVATLPISHKSAIPSGRFESASMDCDT